MRPLQTPRRRVPMTTQGVRAMTLHTERSDTAPAATNDLGAPTDAPVIDVLGHHPTDLLGRHLDTYLAAVARELKVRGVITGSPQRTDPAQQLLGSIVLDCTALRVAAWKPRRRTSRPAVPRRRRPPRTARAGHRDLGRGHGLVRRAAPRPRPFLAALPAPRPAPHPRRGRRLRRGPSPGPTPRLRPPITTTAHGRPRLRRIR